MPEHMLLVGDVLERLAELPERSVHVVVTSPPFWGLRSYLPADAAAKHLELGQEAQHDCLGWATGGDIWELRSDLTDDEVVYVYRELIKAGALGRAS